VKHLHIMYSDKDEPRSDPRTPDTLSRKRPGDKLETQTPSKRQQNKTSQTTPRHNRNETPIVTPRTDGLGKPTASKLAKQVSGFPILVELVTFIISWELERDGQFTDRELGERLKTFIDQIVRSYLSSILLICFSPINVLILHWLRRINGICWLLIKFKWAAKSRLLMIPLGCSRATIS
jgi:hypothetical protein